MPLCPSSAPPLLPPVLTPPFTDVDAMASQMAVVLSLLLTLAPTSSFHAPSTFLQRAAPLKAFNPFELGTAMNPSLHSLPFDMSALAHSLPPLLLSDEFTDAATAATAAVGDAAASVVAADAGNGWFGFLAGPIEQLLGLIHSIICSISPDGAWGWSIILLTVLIKALTYPLSYQQIASTSKMQSLQPSLKALQKKYASNPEVMNQQVSTISGANENAARMQRERSERTQLTNAARTQRMSKRTYE